MTFLLYRLPILTHKYQTVLMSMDVYSYNCPFFDLIHTTLLIKKSRTHQVSSFEYKRQSSSICRESRIHIRVSMNSSQSRHTVLINPNEVTFLVNYYMLGFVILTCSHFVCYHFGFFGKQDLYLVLGELAESD